MSPKNNQQQKSPSRSTEAELTSPRLTNCLAAEALGTFLLVFGGCGTALITAGHTIASPAGGSQQLLVGGGYLAVALAFGLTVVVGAYAFGPISGGHFNPAVTLGLAAAGRFPWTRVVAYIVAQIVGGIVAGLILFAIAAGGAKTNGQSLLSSLRQSGFASNGYGSHSPAGYSMVSVIIAEFVLTAIFLYIIIGATSKFANPGMAGLAIGLTLALIHMISIPVDNTSVNPARSIGVAIFASNGAIGQVWLFIIFPIVGGMVAGFTHKLFFGHQS